MGGDDLRFGDRGGGGGGGQGDLPPEFEYIIRLIVLVIMLYVLYSVGDTLLFGGMLPG